MQLSLKIKAALMAVIASALLVTACGGSEDSASGEASVEGKTIGWVDATLEGAYQQRIHSAATAAVEHLGWEMKTVDTKGDPAEAASGVSSLVTQGVDAILMSGVTPATARTGLLAAQRKDIPVVLVGSEVEPELNEQLDLTYYGPSEEALTAPLGEYIAGELKPGDKVGMLTTSFLISGEKGRSDPLTKILEDAGIEVVGALETDFSFNGGMKNASTLLTQHPDLAALVPVYDLWTAASVAAAKRAGRGNGETQVYSYFADKINNPLMRKNPKIVKGLADGNMIISPLIAIDQLLKHFADGSEMDPNAADGAFEYETITIDTLPPGDQDGPVSEKDALDPYLKQWEEEYGITP